MGVRYGQGYLSTGCKDEHRCPVPSAGWWTRRKNHLCYGAIWICECQQKWKLILDTGIADEYWTWRRYYG